MMHNHTNATAVITSTVIIRVTPQHDHLYSWSILWCGFLITASLGAWQVWKEYKLLKVIQQQELIGGGHHSRRHNASGVDVESQAINEAGVSTADLTRCMVCLSLGIYVLYSRIVSVLTPLSIHISYSIIMSVSFVDCWYWP
jgi:hypothetical protein